MDRWKSRGGKSPEKRSSEKIRAEKSEKKEEAGVQKGTEVAIH